MFKLSFALCLPLALCAMAQEKSAANDAPAHATESNAAAAATAQLPVLPLNFQDTLKKLTGKSAVLCSIPLLQVPIPPGTNFTLRHATPDLIKLAPMPQGKGPAPSCASTPR